MPLMQVKVKPSIIAVCSQLNSLSCQTYPPLTLTSKNPSCGWWPKQTQHAPIFEWIWGLFTPSWMRITHTTLPTDGRHCRCGYFFTFINLNLMSVIWNPLFWHLQAVKVLKSSRSLTITVLTGAVSTLLTASAHKYLIGQSHGCI